MMDWLQFLDMVLLPIGLALVGYFYKTSYDLRKEMAAVEISTRQEMHALNEDVNSWKLSVVQNYATKLEMEKMEARIMVALERLDAKLDRVLGRFGHAD